MEVLISRIARSSSSASRSSTMRGDVAVLAPHHPAVAGWVGDLGAEHGAGGVPFAVEGDQVGDGLGSQQRRVAGQDDHVAVVLVQRVVGEAREPDAHRVARPPLDLLLHEADQEVGPVVLQALGDPLGVVADDDHDPIQLAAPEGVEHVAEHRAAAEEVERLRAVRLHAGALTGSQHDRREGPSAHASCLPRPARPRDDPQVRSARVPARRSIQARGTRAPSRSRSSVTASTPCARR